MELRGGGGRSLALSPVPLQLCTRHASCGKEKEGPGIHALFRFHETVNYTGYFRHN